MSTQGISFAQFERLAPRIIRSRKPIMGHGAHGIGKSMIVYQLAPKLGGILGPEFQAKYGKNYTFPVIERRASQMADTGDVIGVPEPKDSDYGRITTFAPMAWFARACKEPCILFFDEVDRANNDVRQSLMELTDSRKIAGHFLHPDTIIIAMVNGGNHDKNNAYQVSELDPAEQAWSMKVKSNRTRFILRAGLGITLINVFRLRKKPVTIYWKRPPKENYRWIYTLSAKVSSGKKLRLLSKTLLKNTKNR
jgi:hypothetical protein